MKGVPHKVEVPVQHVNLHVEVVCRGCWGKLEVVCVGHNEHRRQGDDVPLDVEVLPCKTCDFIKESEL